MKVNTGERRASRLRQLTVLAAGLAVLATAACGGSQGATASEDGAEPAAAPAVLSEDEYLSNGADFVDAAKDVKPTKVHIELGEMFFEPKAVTLEAGKPYQLELVNTGKVKHEFTAAKFFRSVATRKVESESSEVKAPFFTEIEVFAGKTASFFVIPIIPGSFEMLCEIEGHREAGMEGTITVTGSAPKVPAPVFASMKAGPWLQNGPDLVKAASATWNAKAVTVRVEAGEDGAKMYFKPNELVLKAGTPYVIELVNVGKVKHEYTAAEFFPTVAFRKAEDAEGEYKALLLNEAEVLAGKQLDLYLIPTKTGTFEIVCEIAGHREAGMFGTVVVTG
jgi:uncharacterized cupredoxin-like copper-binding protein